CLRVYDLASQDEFHRLAFAHKPGQTLRTATTGNDAQIDLRLSEGSLLAGDANVASERHLASATQTIPVDHGDYRFGKTVDRVEERTFQHHFALRDRGAFRELGDVSAGNKSLIARAGDDDYTNGIVRAQFIQNRRAFRA